MDLARFSFLAVAVICTARGSAVAQTSDRFQEARLRMVENDLVREGIKNPAVLRSMRSVPRHLFVAQQYRAAAYFDQALPIGQRQTISPPFIVAYMTEMIDPQPTDKVLEIGTGSGYQAAVLSGIVKEVYTIEIVEQLGKNAARVFKDLKYDNVRAMVGDGYKGWPQYAPFDKIIVTCSPEDVPQPLVDQLRDGGKMIIPLGERYEQVFYLFEKKGNQLVSSKLLPALFVPMTGISEDNRKVKPDPARPEVRNGGFEEDADENGFPDGWHYQRQLTLAKERAPEGAAFVKMENQDTGRGSQMLQGMAVDGTKVSFLKVSLQIQGTDLRNGDKAPEKPALVVHFFDADRRPLGEEHIGPWQGTFEWKQVVKNLAVPPKAREAILRIGLNGGTGTLCVDDVRLSPVAR